MKKKLTKFIAYPVAAVLGAAVGGGIAKHLTKPQTATELELLEQAAPSATADNMEVDAQPLPEYPLTREEFVKFLSSAALPVSQRQALCERYGITFEELVREQQR